MKTTTYIQLTIVVLLCTTQFVSAARPSAFNNDLLLLYLGIGLMLLGILGFDRLMNFIKHRTRKTSKNITQ